MMTMATEPNEKNIDAATDAHEKYDDKPTDASRQKLRDAEGKLTHEEMSTYLANYNNRLMRRRSEAALRLPDQL